MPATLTISKDALLISLGELGSRVEDRVGALKVAGELMRTSIALTFREEGSPAGSWPQLAASTLKKKAYTAGHKLLILSGRLFGSITYQVSDGQLTIGTNVIYAGVQQRGSGGGGIAAVVAKAGGHATRRQNIPARPYLVFRPEDPARIASGIEAYLQGPSRTVFA